MKKSFTWLMIGLVAGIILCSFLLSKCGKGVLDTSHDADRDTINNLRVQVAEQGRIADSSTAYWKKAYDSLELDRGNLEHQKDSIDNQLDKSKVTITGLVKIIHQSKDTALKLISCDSLASKITLLLTQISADSLKSTAILESYRGQIAALLKSDSTRQAKADSLRIAFSKATGKYDGLMSDYKTLQDAYLNPKGKVYLSMGGLYFNGELAVGAGFMYKSKHDQCFEVMAYYGSNMTKVYQGTWKLPISLRRKTRLTVIP